MNLLHGFNLLGGEQSLLNSCESLGWYFLLWNVGSHDVALYRRKGDLL